MTIENLKYWLSISFMIALALSVVGYLIYERLTKSRSEERFTVCEITENYFSPKDIGKKYEYYIGGKRYEGICTSQKCVDAKIGSWFLMKFWVDKPEWTEIYLDQEVRTILDVPDEGWDELPKL